MCDLRLSPDGTTVAYWSREIQPMHNPGDDWYPHARDLDTGEDVVLPLGYGMQVGVVFTFAPDGKTFGFRWDQSGQQRTIAGHGTGRPPRRPWARPSTPAWMGASTSRRTAPSCITRPGTPAETRIYDLAGGSDVVLPGVTSLPTWQRLAK